MKTKVKVAISRLRGLLDAYASYIMTVKVPQPVGKPLAGYQLHESADFVVVECSEDDVL